jgi:hypothetical protein
MTNPMPVSLELRGDFAKLKGQVEEAQSTIIEAAEQDEADVEAKVGEARHTADARAAEVHDKPQQADGAESHWQQVRSDWDAHVKRTREHLDAKKASIEADDAEADAEWAEADAEDAIGFAASTIDEATYAVLRAVKARKHADALAGSA